MMLVPLTKGGDIALDKDSPALSPCSCLGIDGCLSWWATTHSGIEAMHTASCRLSPSNIVPLCPASACMRLDEGSGLKRIARIDRYRVNYNDVPFSTQLDLSFTYFHTHIRLSYIPPTMSIKLRPASPPQPFSFAPTSPPSQHGASSSKTPTTGAGNATNPIEFILEKDQSMFGAYPLETERGKGLLKCRKCAKIVAEAAAGEHVRTLYLTGPHMVVYRPLSWALLTTLQGYVITYSTVRL